MIDPTIAKQKLEEYVEAGRSRAAGVIEHVMNSQPEDAVIRTNALAFSARDPEQRRAGRPANSGDGWSSRDIFLATATSPSRWTLHENALSQANDRLGLPGAYAKDLLSRGGWGAELLAANLTELAQHHAGRVLVRSIFGEARGFLSDSYRRLDSRPLVEAVTGAWSEAGALPIDGVVTETRVTLRAILPQVLEPTPGEYVVLGAAWENSDFGRGAHALRGFLYRLICGNGATMEQLLRQVHLGSRLTEDVAFSSRTYALDTKATASALRDVARFVLSDEKIEAGLSKIRGAAAAELPAAEADRLLKKHLNKGEAQQVKDAFSSAEVVMLPPGQNKWRLSNALSWVAQKVEDPERRLDLQRLAGAVINDPQLEQRAA